MEISELFELGGRGVTMARGHFGTDSVPQGSGEGAGAWLRCCATQVWKRDVMNRVGMGLSLPGLFFVTLVIRVKSSLIHLEE